MSDQIVTTLKKRLEETSVSAGEISVEALRNAVKEVLQYYVLNFIYHHPEYSHWIMYGGSALRICYDLDRMSVDLDFEIDHKVTKVFLEKLKQEMLAYFEDSYGVSDDFLTIGTTNNRGLTLKFHVAEELGLPFHSKQVHVKIDLNHFDAGPGVVTERWPQNEHQLSFSIKTYNLSALMASKIAAIFLRGPRGVGKRVFQEKGRDIYDLLWYMGKKIVPDLDYLKAKNVQEAEDLRTLFDKLTIKMNDVSDKNLKNDLAPLFVNQAYIENWLGTWRELFMRRFEQYEIRTVTDLEKVEVHKDLATDVFSFVYTYRTKDDSPVRVICRLSDYWIIFSDGDLTLEVSETIRKHLEFNSTVRTTHPPSQEKLMQYAELFYQKIEKYWKKTNQVMLGDIITTKMIRMTADKLNPKDQVLLNKSALVSSELEDLLQ